jgi:aspartate aminotransferase
MTRGAFPPPALRFDSVGFSEIVRVRNRVLDLLALGEKVWRFEGGEPYMPTPPPIRDAMTRALQRGETRYAPSSGIPELRTAIVAKVARKNGIPADRDSPIVVNGGMHGLFASFATLVNPGDEVMLLSPYWTPIVDVITYHGGVPVLVSTAAARRDGALSNARTGRHRQDEGPLLELADEPHGRRLLARRDRRDVALRVRARPRGDFGRGVRGPDLTKGESHVSPASLPGMEERTISVFTFSKTYSMTGWRAGYVIVPERYRAAMRSVVLYSINGVSTPTQWAALEALSFPDDFLREAREGYRRRRDRLAAGLVSAGFQVEKPRAALYLFPKIPASLGSDSRKAAETLLDSVKVATVPGMVFGPEGEGHLRFSFSVAEEMIAGGVEALATLSSKELQQAR